MAAERVLLGVDLGAGSLKATVLEPGGEVRGEVSEPLRTEMPRLGWSEQDPEAWYVAFCAAVPAALAAASAPPQAVAAIALSAGTHTPVLLDAADRVIRPAILWSDQRSAEEAAELHARAGALIIARSLNRVNPTWTLAMLRWLQQHEPQAIARVRRLLFAKDYLRFRLTGTWYTDFSDVIGSAMGDVGTRGWSPEICALIDWPMETLPPVVQPTDIVGGVGAAAAAASGLIPGTPVVCGSSDTTVELYGAGAVEPEMGAVKLATAGVLYRVTEGPVVNPPISCYPHLLPGLYYTAAGTNACASAHRWVRDQMFPPIDGGGGGFAEMERLAVGAPPGSAGLLFHPYLQGERAPYWDPQLRADFIGLTMQHGRAHFARAVYEGIAFSIRDLLQEAEALGQRFGEIRLIGGGARSPTWRQIMADVLGLRIATPEHGDASYGAALVAGVGIGLFASARQAVEACVRITDHHEPDPGRQPLYSELFAIYKDAQAALAPIDHRLHRLMAGDAS